MPTRPATLARPRLRPILMPAEHGGWSFIGAPIILGLAMAPSWTGLSISVAGLLMFLSRQPLKMAAKDILLRKRFPRTAWALGIGGAELLIALCILTLAIATSSKPLLLPTGVFLGVAVVQFAYDSLGKGRNTFPEVIGASAAAIIATIVGIAGTLDELHAWLLAAILALHSTLAIVYVGVRLDLAHSRSTSIPSVWLTAAASVALVATLVGFGWIGWLMLLTFAILAGRALWGTSAFRKDFKPHVIGIQEIAYTLLVVASASISVGSS